MIAEQGHGAIGEPVQKLSALAPNGRGVVPHLRLQLRPVADGRADVAEHPAKLGGKFAPAARIGAVELDVHQRFPPFPVAAERLDRLEDAGLVAGDADHRVKQPVDRQLAGGDGIGD